MSRKPGQGRVDGVVRVEGRRFKVRAGCAGCSARERSLLERLWARTT